jgi:hypothetical protein
MPRYIVQRSFDNGRENPIANGDADTRRTFVRRNAELGVSWFHSYVSDDGKTTFCIYDAPTPDALRATAAANDLPIDRITPVSLVDPYFRVN